MQPKKFSIINEEIDTKVIFILSPKEIFYSFQYYLFWLSQEPISTFVKPHQFTKHIPLSN